MSSKVVSCIYDLLDLGSTGTWMNDGTIKLNRPPVSSKLDRIKFRSFSATILPSINNTSLPNIYGELRANIYQFDSSGSINEYSTADTPTSFTINSLNGNKTYGQDEDSILLSTFSTSITNDLESSIDNALAVGKSTLAEFLSCNFTDQYRYRPTTISLNIPDNFYSQLQLPQHCPIWCMPTYCGLSENNTVFLPPCYTKAIDLLAPPGWGLAGITYQESGNSIDLSINGYGRFDVSTVGSFCGATSFAFLKDTSSAPYAIINYGDSDASNTSNIDNTIAPNQQVPYFNDLSEYIDIGWYDSYSVINTSDQSSTRYTLAMSAKYLDVPSTPQSYYGVSGCIVDPTGLPALQFDNESGTTETITLPSYGFVHLYYGPYEPNAISFKQSVSLNEFVSKVNANQAYLELCLGSYNTAALNNGYTIVDMSGILQDYADYFTSTFSTTELDNAYILDIMINTFDSSDGKKPALTMRYVSNGKMYFRIRTFTGTIAKGTMNQVSNSGYNFLFTYSFTLVDEYKTYFNSDIDCDSFFADADAKNQFKQFTYYATFTHNAQGYFNVYNNIVTNIRVDPSSLFVFPTMDNVIPINATKIGTLTQNDNLCTLNVTGLGSTTFTLDQEVPVTGFIAYGTGQTSIQSPLIPMSGNTPQAQLSSSDPYDYYRTYTSSISIGGSTIAGQPPSVIECTSLPGTTEVNVDNHVKFGSINTIIIDANTINDCFALNVDPTGVNPTTYQTLVLLTTDKKFAIEFFVSLYTEPDVFEFSRQYAPLSLYNSSGVPIFKGLSWQLTNNATLTFNAEESINNIAPSLVGNIDTYIKLRNTDLTLKLICNDFPTLNNTVFYLNETAMIDFKEAACSPTESVLECRIVDYNGNILIPTDASLLYSSITISVDWQFY